MRSCQQGSYESENRDASAWKSEFHPRQPSVQIVTVMICNDFCSLSRKYDATETSDTPHLTEQSRFLTEEESRAIMENQARTKFGMSLDEFRKAWKAGEFDDDYERHDDVVGWPEAPGVLERLMPGGMLHEAAGKHQEILSFQLGMPTLAGISSSIFSSWCIRKGSALQLFVILRRYSKTCFRKEATRWCAGQVGPLRVEEIRASLVWRHDLPNRLNQSHYSFRT